MTKTELVTSATRAFSKVGFQLKKHSPEILAVTGVVGAVTSVVLACKSTLKVNEVLDETKINIEKVHMAKEVGLTEGGVEYTAEDSKKDLTIIYTQTGFKFVKLYAPAVIIGVAAIGCLLQSNNILRKRNMALAAAYATIDKGFKEYRERVVDRFGADVDRQLRYNIKAKEIEETVIDENGKEKTVKKTVEVMDPTKVIGYERCFDEFNSTEWERSPDYNLMFLKAQQAAANNILTARGYIFLNEIYEMLGMDKSLEEQLEEQIDETAGEEEEIIAPIVLPVVKEEASLAEENRVITISNHPVNSADVAINKAAITIPKISKIFIPPLLRSFKI